MLLLEQHLIFEDPDGDFAGSHRTTQKGLVKGKGVLKCSSPPHPGSGVRFLSASLAICPEKISEMLERLPRAGRELGAAARELCRPMPRPRWDGASRRGKPRRVQLLSAPYRIGWLPPGLSPVFLILLPRC